MCFKIYEEFTPELQEIWQEFYKKNPGIYSSSFEWCQTWFRYFSKDKNLFVITIWQDESLKLIAPFYKKGNKLYGIGSSPDFYDTFCILYEDRNYLLDLVNFIIEKNFEADLRLIHPMSEFFQYLLRRMEQENIYKVRIYNYVIKPLIFETNELKMSLQQKYKRLKRKENLAKRDFNDELKYDLITEKNEKYIQEFMNFHKKKWNTFKLPKTQEFIKDLYLNNDFVMLSRLYLKNSNKSVAYSFKYKSPDNVLYNNMFSYNEEFAAMSPGLLVTYYDISSDMAESSDHIDYGTGSYKYKYYFANKDEVVLNVKADLCWKQYKRIYLFLKNFKNKLVLFKHFYGNKTEDEEVCYNPG